MCSQRWRETNEEKRALERSNADMIAGARHSAEVHRQASVYLGAYGPCNLYGVWESSTFVSGGQVAPCVTILLSTDVQVRNYIRTIAKPGVPMVDLCETLENSVRQLIEESGLAAGIAFPTGEVDADPSIGVNPQSLRSTWSQRQQLAVTCSSLDD